jgi:L-fuconolactonase
MDAPSTANMDIAEEILDRDSAIIDAHHHFYGPGPDRYLLDDFLADVSSGHRVVGSVYVETLTMAHRDGPEWLRPIGEVEFANAIAASCAYGPCRVASGIVCHADLTRGSDVAKLLDRAVACAPERLRAVRQIALSPPGDSQFRFHGYRPPADLLLLGSVREGLREVGARQLCFETAIFHHQLPDLCRVADQHRDVTIILDHMGLALGIGLDDRARHIVFEAWASGLRELAAFENVVCKIGGLGSPIWGFGFERLRGQVTAATLGDAWTPYVRVAVDAFGAQRCMLGSNFPRDRQTCSYAILWNALQRTIAGYSESERRLLLHDTAARVYRLASD